MTIYLYRILFISLALLSTQVGAWTNHTLVSQELVTSMDHFKQAKPVKAESLESFLMANEEAIAAFLQLDEAWMAQNLWHYNPRPKALAFKATGNREDVVKRFTQAIRVNPNTRFALYIQGVPGSEQKGEKFAPAYVSVFKNHGHLNDVPLIALKEGELVSPVDVVVSANDEPDHGHDIGLFTDSGTDYGLEYGFGKQPFGNPNLEYGTQAPFHMGFYHEPSILYAVGGFLKETYPQMRVHQYKGLAELAFKKGHDYWGYRFMGWGLHYIADFSNPYHVTPVPGNSTVSTIWLGILGILGFEEPQKEAVQLVSNRHTVLEDFQYAVMTRSYLEHNQQHQTIQSLSVKQPIMAYDVNTFVDVFAKTAYDKADHIDAVLQASFPFDYVQNTQVEYSDLNALPTLESTVKQHSGEAGYKNLVNDVSDLLGDFSKHGAAYIDAILKAKQ